MAGWRAWELSSCLASLLSAFVIPAEDLYPEESGGHR